MLLFVIQHLVQHSSYYRLNNEDLKCFFLSQDLQRLNCEHRTENETRVVVCDLGNPMVADTNVRVLSHKLD